MAMEYNETSESILYVNENEQLYITDILKLIPIFNRYKFVKHLAKIKYGHDYKNTIFIHITKFDGSKIESLSGNFNFINYTGQPEFMYFYDLIKDNKDTIYSNEYLFKDYQYKRTGILTEMYYPLKLSFYKYENDKYIPIPFGKWIKVKEIDIKEKENIKKRAIVRKSIIYTNELPRPTLTHNISYSGICYCIPKDKNVDFFNYLTFSNDSIYESIDENIFNVFMYNTELNKFFKVTLNDKLNWDVVFDENDEKNISIKDTDASTKYKIVTSEHMYFNSDDKYDIISNNNSDCIFDNLKDAISTLEKCFMSIKLTFGNSYIYGYMEPNRQAFTIILKNGIYNKKKVSMAIATYMIVSNFSEKF